MSNAKPLTLDVIEKAAAGGYAAFRSITRLQPVGGRGDKVFPPTYAAEDSAASKYAQEKRRIDGHEVSAVLLDSVQSQANRMEAALEGAWRAGRIRIPVIQVDFTGEEGLNDLQQITSLGAPHRIADALLRDSMLGDQPFRMSEPGRAFTDARANNATALFKYCPTALVFGMWDSTGPRGGLGAKFARALVSEIVGLGVVAGVKTASRIDPAGIEKLGGDAAIYKHATEGWTLDRAAAAKDDKGNPVPVGKEGKTGNPSAVNHGNVAPTIDPKAGGVTMDYAMQTTVLSLPALRRLGFPSDTAGAALTSERRPQAERAARTALAGLALAAIACQREEGYDLRSRCALVPEASLTLELVPADGGAPEAYTLTSSEALQLLEQAAAGAAKAGMQWNTDAITLRPAPKLADLIRRSRAIEMSEPVEAE